MTIRMTPEQFLAWLPIVMWALSWLIVWRLKALHNKVRDKDGYDDWAGIIVLAVIAVLLIIAACAAGLAFENLFIAYGAMDAPQ